MRWGEAEYLAVSLRPVLAVGVRQHMSCIEWARFGPATWAPAKVPDVDVARPARCRRCGGLAKQGGRIFLHGHGVRTRGVVLPGLGDDLPRTGTCWTRRYRCIRCEALVTVLPPGVLPHMLYSLLAIVRAFILVVEEPIGQGVDHETAYRCQGRWPTMRWTKPWPYRWRALGRWAARIQQWWPGRVATDLSTLLVGGITEAGDDLCALLGWAVASHVRCGAAM